MTRSLLRPCWFPYIHGTPVSDGSEEHVVNERGDTSSIVPLSRVALVNVFMILSLKATHLEEQEAAAGSC